MNRRPLAWAAALAAALLLAFPASAQQAGEVTLALAQTTRADGKVDVSLTWSTAPKATGCQASGSWTGSRSASRSSPLVFSGVTPPASYTLTCSWPGAVDDDILVRWQPPTENEDGTPLTNLAGFRIYYGTAAGSLSQTRAINEPGATSHLLKPLAPGTWFLAMTALNAEGTESKRTATISATLTATSVQASKTVTVKAEVPGAPANVTAVP